MRKKTRSKKLRNAVTAYQNPVKKKSRKRVSSATRSSEYSDPLANMLRGGIRK